MTGALPTPCLLCGSTSGDRHPTGWVCTVCGWRVGDVPDPDLPPPRVDVVYYLRHADRIKIGTTANPRQRFRQIWHEQLVAFELGDRTLERARHDQFAPDRFEGSEWFRMSRPLRDHLTAISRGPDPWARYARWVAEAYVRSR
ncbi:MAG: GIY-YIG nuclease family protein [Pseudolysinimonas sp.]